MSSNNPLADEPFRYRKTKDDRVQVFHRNRLAVTLSGAAAGKFLSRIERVDAAGAQQLMARATGQFKFGNERVGKDRQKEKG